MQQFNIMVPQDSRDFNDQESYSRSLIEAALDPLVTIGPDGKITDVNSATEKVTGVKRDQLIGTDFCNYFTEPEKAEAGYKQVFRDGFVKDYPLEIRHHDGHITPVLYNATVYKDETGNVTGVFAAARDITERKLYEARLQRLNQLYAALSQTNEAIVRSSNEEDLFHQICKIAVENGGMLMAWVGVVETATKTVKPTIWYGAGSEEYLKGIPISTKADDPYGKGPTGTSIRENKPVWCQDFKHDPMTAPWHERAEKFGWNSSASLPLTKNGIPFGSLTLYSSSLNAFDEEAQRLLLEMTKDINFAMDNFVHAAELKKAEEKIRQSEKRFRQTLDGMFEGCMILGFDWTYLYMNDVAAQHGQNKKENLLGRTILEMYPGVEKSPVFAHYRKCMEERVKQRFEETFTFADGSTHWYSFSVEPVTEGIFVLSIEITDQKKAEEELKASELKYSTLVEKGNDGILIIGDDGLFKYVNSIVCGMTGFTKEESIGMPFLNIVAPEYKELVAARYSKRIKGQEVTNKYDLEVISKTGKRTPVEVNANRIEYDGKPAVMGILRDITDRKEAEEALHKSEEELKEAQRVARIGSWSWDIATDKITWSPQYYELFGYDPSKQPPGYEEHLKVYTPESQARLDEAVKRSTKTGEPYELDLELVNQTGPIHWITARSETVRDENGKITGLRGTAQDITAKKEGIEKLEKTSRALKTLSLVNQELVRTKDEQELLNTICDIITKEGGYTFAWIGYAGDDEEKSIQVMAQVGFDKGYLETLGLSWADNEHGKRPICVAMRTGEISVVNDVEKNADHRFPPEEVQKYGYKAVAAFPLKVDEKVIGAIAISSKEANAFDADEIKLLLELANDLSFGIKSVHMTEEHKKSEERIEELNEVRNKFIEIISHQLRTPLGAVNWNLEMLLNGEFGKLDPTQEQFLKVTYNASLRTTSRIHDLLTAMDVEEGKVIFEHEEMALDTICAEITRSKMDECKLKEITCTYTPPEKDLPLIKGDPGKIRMVITKLIENAISYTKDRGHISAKLSMVDDNIRFEIADNGIGIPQTEQHRIFSRFFRASNAFVMLTDAFGLGLYLAKHFIEQHKGKIGFTSREGEGSTFWFEIPVK